MALSTMYDAKPNSPQTTLAGDITAADTSMTLTDASVLPAAPNLCTIGDDENAEVVIYGTITGNVVSNLIRGSSGTAASVWAAGTYVARDFTSYDHDTFIDNIQDLNTSLGNKADLASPDFTGAPTAPTATSGDSSTKIATTAFVHGELDKEILYFTSQTVSTANNAQIMRIPSSGTNSAITTDTVVLECYFADPSKVTSVVSWQSNTGYVTFTGTCTAGTTANVVLGNKGN